MKGWGENFFENEEGDEAEQHFNIYICARLMLHAFIFNLCAYIPEESGSTLNYL